MKNVFCKETITKTKTTDDHRLSYPIISHKTKVTFRRSIASKEKKENPRRHPYPKAFDVVLVAPFLLSDFSFLSDGASFKPLRFFRFHIWP